VVRVRVVLQGAVQYQVKWPDAQPKWVTEKDLDAPALIQDYKARKAQQRQRAEILSDRDDSDHELDGFNFAEADGDEKEKEKEKEKEENGKESEKENDNDAMVIDEKNEKAEKAKEEKAKKKNEAKEKEESDDENGEDEDILMVRELTTPKRKPRRVVPESPLDELLNSDNDGEEGKEGKEKEMEEEEEEEVETTTKKRKRLSKGKRTTTTTGGKKQKKKQSTSEEEEEEVEDVELDEEETKELLKEAAFVIHGDDKEKKRRKEKELALKMHKVHPCHSLLRTCTSQPLTNCLCAVCGGAVRWFVLSCCSCRRLSDGSASPFCRLSAGAPAAKLSIAYAHTHRTHAPPLYRFFIPHFIHATAPARWQGFEFAGTIYRVGDCVALRPEDEADDWYAIIDELYEVPSLPPIVVCVRAVCDCVPCRYERAPLIKASLLFDRRHELANLRCAARGCTAPRTCPYGSSVASSCGARAILVTSTFNWLGWLLRAQEELVDDLHVKELCLSNHIDPNPVNSISRRILGTRTRTHAHTHTHATRSDALWCSP
jgi:hypothetical protein